MRDFPKLRIQQIISSLTLPNLVHFGESIFYTRHREELVFCAIDEEHRLRTGEGSNVGIVEILAKTGDTTDVVQKEMYTFDDKGGRSITLFFKGLA